MALAWEIVYTVKDLKGKTSFIKINIQYEDEGLPGFSTFEEVENIADFLAPVLDDLITGVIQRISINRQIPLPGGLKSAATSTSDVEEKGVFIFRTLESKPRVTLPTIRDSLVVDGTDLIDTSNVDVAAFLFDMTDGSGTPMEFVRASDYRDAVIFNYEEVYERFRSS